MRFSLLPSRRTQAAVAGIFAVGLVVTVAGSLAGSAAQVSVVACACGGAISNPGDQVEILDETAIIEWDGGVETITLALDADTNATDFALLVPTPAPAKATLGDATLFDDLAAISTPREVSDWQWWPVIGSAPGSRGVEVLDVVRLGPLEVTTLAASEAGELTDWLDAHGYVMTDAMATSLLPYIEEGWYFVAAKIATDAQGDPDLSGALQPIMLTFDSDEVVYPMRMSAAATSTQHVRTYIVADHRMERTDVMADDSWVRFAGTLETDGVDKALGGEPSTALLELLDGRYLTTIDQYFREPMEEIVADFTFAQAADDAEFVATVEVLRPVPVLGVLAGPIILLGVIVACVLLTVRSYRRAGNPPVAA